jgi:hypothetical protein
MATFGVFPLLADAVCMGCAPGEHIAWRISPDWIEGAASVQVARNRSSGIGRAPAQPATARRRVADGRPGQYWLGRQCDGAGAGGHPACLPGPVHGVTPNSLSNWIAPSRADAPRAAETVLREIASRIPAGLALCSPPGTGLTTELRVQRQIETDHQTPMIPELLAGEGRFSGPAGYEAYLRQLMPFKAAFAPINEQLLNEWRHNQDKLFQLRDAAERHLWPFLHSEWIPALECGEASAEQFIELLDRALNHHRIASLVGQRGRMAMVVSSAGVGGITSALQAIVGSSLTALPTAAGSGIAAGVAAGTGVAMSMLAHNAAKKSDQRRSDADQLTVFYQQAEKIAS